MSDSFILPTQTIPFTVMQIKRPKARETTDDEREVKIGMGREKRREKLIERDPALPNG